MQTLEQANQRAVELHWLALLITGSCETGVDVVMETVAAEDVTNVFFSTRRCAGEPQKGRTGCEFYHLTGSVQCRSRELAFDPTRLRDGIELSDDPLPALRSRVYAISAAPRRRRQQSR